MDPAVYEKLGAFYLGREYDAAAGEMRDDLLLYDSKDLTTHAVCVGMTGSGKTGLCVSLLEEAAIDGVPAICIDPKGDLGNLLLTFPGLKPGDFEPWVDPGAAQRKGMSVKEYAADRAKLWKKGLGGWGQGGDRIQRFRDAVDLAIYTPGSNAGLPLSVLRSFNAPPQAVRDDADAMRERVTASVSGLLALLGIKADPLRSREHILLANIVDTAWRAGRDLDLGQLMEQIQNPPFKRVGVIDLETFYPEKERFELVLAMNGLLASPSFASWLEGDPLDIQRLLYTAEGKPRLSIISIAHLSDPERMFIVTLILNELVAWMRAQPGTGSLRALMYMDEVFGYFPPTANPPSKQPMLTLMKQARAFGVGCVLATQNPVDLDYKGLSNAGTWFLGRLQTERDKKRVIDGLEGAAATAGGGLDRKDMDRLLSGLGSRVFLMNNVHDDEPVIFHTRWAMSYLRGPLTRDQISTLMDERRSAGAPPKAAPPAKTPAASPIPADDSASSPPPLPPGIDVGYLPLTRSIPRDASLVYRPAVLGGASLHYVRVAAKVDDYRDVTLLALLGDDTDANIWEAAIELPDHDPELEDAPDSRGTFADLPPVAAKEKQYDTWTKKLKSFIYRERALDLWQAKSLKMYSALGETQGHFRVRLRDVLRERRDMEMEKLKKKYEPKVATLRDRIRKAEQKVEKEKEQYRAQKYQTAVSFGTSVLGAIFGRKRSATTTARGVGRAAKERGDIGRAEENVEALQQKLRDLESDFQGDLEATESMVDPEGVELTRIVLRPRKGDMTLREATLVWAPFRVVDGRAEPAFDMPESS